METKKILKKQKKAEDKLKERQARLEKEVTERKETESAEAGIGERIRERRISNVSAASHGSEKQETTKESKPEPTKEEKGGDEKFFS